MLCNGAEMSYGAAQIVLAMSHSKIAAKHRS
jgi:hypothetical protein